MEISRTLQAILRDTPGIQHIFVTDKEGVPIVGVSESSGFFFFLAKIFLFLIDSYL